MQAEGTGEELYAAERREGSKPYQVWVLYRIVYQGHFSGGPELKNPFVFLSTPIRGRT